jgi:hypothetical protein
MLSPQVMSKGINTDESEPFCVGLSDCPTLVVVRRDVDRLAAGLDHRRPLLEDHVLHLRRQRHIVDLGGDRVAALVRPVKELQHDRAGGGIGLLLVDQDKGRVGDRPTLNNSRT